LADLAGGMCKPHYGNGAPAMFTYYSPLISFKSADFVLILAMTTLLKQMMILQLSS
jgi:hypothetical protein